ncbi:MAG: hypothetical protein B7X42_04890, partial [Thiomonas sp. 14-66-4]
MGQGWNNPVPGRALASIMTTEDLKTQFRQQSQAALSLDIAYIGVVNGLFSALHRLGRSTPQALAQASGILA